MEEADWELVLPACRATIEYVQARAAKEWVKDLDLEKVVETINEADAWIVDETYLVMYVVDTPWYGNKPWLLEQLVLALKPGGDFSAVTDFLEDRARAEGCSFCVVGTALAPSDKALARLYTRQGYQGEVITLTKEL